MNTIIHPNEIYQMLKGTRLIRTVPYLESVSKEFRTRDDYLAYAKKALTTQGFNELQHVLNHIDESCPFESLEETVCFFLNFY